MDEHIDNIEQADAQAAQLLQLQHQLQRLEAQQQQQQQQRGIGATDTPHTFYHNRAAICPPEIARQDYEIKPQMIALVKQYQFHGLPAENPMEHIENFEEICSTTKTNGVPADYLKCKLFPFSLADKGMRWLKSLQAGSLKTWPEARSAFLDHFYTKSKTAALRNKIAQFAQHNGESFCEAWERFNEYRRECPHHGYTDEQILSIFYDGVHWDYKNALNAASNGDFMTKTIEGAYELIFNLAASSSSRSVEYDRSKKVNSVDSLKIDEMNEKINQLLKGTPQGNQVCDDGSDVFALQEQNENESDRNQEINYVGGQGFGQNKGFNQNYRNHPNFSYRSTNVENPQDQVYPSQVGTQDRQFQGRQFGQTSGAQNQNQGFNRFQSGYQPKQPFNNYQRPSPAPAPYQPAPAPYQPPVASTSNTQDELKAMMQQLLLNQQKQSTEINVKVDGMYRELNSKIEAVSTHTKMVDAQLAQTAEAVKRQEGVLPAKGEQNPRKEFVNSIALRSGKILEHDAQKPQDSGKALNTEDHNEAEEEEIPKLAEQSEKPPPERVYTPRVPYPTRPKKSKKDLEEAKCKEMMEDLTVKLSLTDAVQMVPALKRYVKNLVTSKISGEDNFVKVTQDCSAVLQNKVITKLGDPGRFALSVQIGRTIFSCSLCDLGSSVNLMPYSVAKRLGFTKFEPTKISLVFADRSVKLPLGILEDLHVQVGNVIIPADFVVLELGDEPKDPLILGRPFLCTAGAMIDVRNGQIDLHLGDIVMKFEMNKLLKRPMLDGQTFTVDHSHEVADDMAEELLMDDPLEIALTKAQDENGFLNEDTKGFADMLDQNPAMEKMVAFMSLDSEPSGIQIDRSIHETRFANVFRSTEAR